MARLSLAGCSRLGAQSIRTRSTARVRVCKMIEEARVSVQCEKERARTARASSKEKNLRVKARVTRANMGRVRTSRGRVRARAARVRMVRMVRMVRAKI